MSLNILHISDLHFGTNSVKDKQATRYCPSFVNSFVKELTEKRIDYLIVTGDIANSSKVIEYEKASAFLDEVVSSLNISKKNVLVCMGNHDISWDILRDVEEIEGMPPDDLYKDGRKYDNFKKFYNDFYKENDNQIQQFKTDSIFVEIADDAHKILFLGVNSCFHESNQVGDHYGCVDKDGFEKIIRELNPKYNDYYKCLVMHHNPKDLGNEKHNFDNWRSVNKDSLGTNFVVFCGHIHGSDGESEVRTDTNSIHYISVGSLLKKSVSAKYNLYYIPDDSSQIEITYYNLQEDSSPDKWYWQDQTRCKSIKKVDLRRPEKKTDVLDVILLDNNEKTKQELENRQKGAQDTPINEKIPKSIILDIIRDQQLYYSGHFHWNTDKKGENSKFKSHGYIDINYLVSHIESLETITQLYKEIIEEIQKEITLNKTLMVSIGLECTVVGARLSVLFPGFGFSYMPRKREMNDHNDIENIIGFSDYDTVIIIKDITFDAEEVVEIIEDQFSQKNIYLISLFYCGKKGEKRDILSGKENAHFYSLIDDIEIPRCNVSESECPIIKNKLQTIYRC